MRLIIFTIMLALTFKVTALEVSNFKSGPACTDGKSFGWICHNTKEVYVTGQAKCTWNGEVKPCTWYGFEFDYSGNKQGTVVECKYVMSEPGSEGNPNEVIKTESNSGSYSFSLKEESGHFYNPQYILLSTQVRGKSLLKENTICMVSGETVFEFGFNVHFPISE